MRLFQEKIMYVGIGLISLTFLIVACSDSIGTEEEPKPATVDEITQSAAFQDAVSSMQKLNRPLVKKMKSSDIEKMKSKISSHINLSTKTFKEGASKEQTVKIMGYKNLQQYKELYQPLENSLNKFHSEFPEYKSLDSKLKKNNFEKAVTRTLDSNNGKIDDSDTIVSCDSDYTDCLSAATNDFARTSVICVSGSAINLVGGIACQSANLMLYEIDKYNCNVAYEQCKSNESNE